MPVQRIGAILPLGEASGDRTGYQTRGTIAARAVAT